jgi:hypothetical protein
MSSVPVKQYPFTDAEAQLISDVMRAYASRISHYANKQWFKGVDLEYVLAQILCGRVHAALLPHYLVVFDLGQVWYNKTLLCVEEKLVLAVSPGGQLREVTDFLEYIARVNDATLVGVGTALAHDDRALSRMYSRLGYQPSGVTLTKRI